jgi:hypothetical protein
VRAHEFIGAREQAKVFVDLDGVCADFFAGYRELNPSVRSEDEMPDGPDSTYELMKGTDFFYRLPKYSSADQLIATVLDFVPEYCILTAPLHGDYKNCKKNKTRWVRRYLTPQPKRIIVTSEKYHYAVDPKTGVPNILIDDRMKNIGPWREAGGIGIKYFAPDDDVAVVRSGLAQVFGR